MSGRPRKQIELELTEAQFTVAMRSTCWSAGVKSEATLKVMAAKLQQAYQDWQRGGGEHIVVRLTEGQGRALLTVITQDGKIGPTTGSWRKAFEKVSRALGVWKEEPRA